MRSAATAADLTLVDVHAAEPGPGRWWRAAVIYQVYPRSFADGDGDGIGDLRGVTARLHHVEALGVDAVWLSPFYPSPLVDAGYDVADHCDVDPLFGTLADFDEMLAAAHGRGLRVIIDLVPNHTSDEHPWFQAALAAEPGSPERDRYLFRRGRGPGGREPPNNWNSLFRGPAWTEVGRLTGRARDDGEWYLHLFDARQPDLNWARPEVRAAFEDVLRFWLDRGVDGFRVDVAHGLVKHPDLPDATDATRVGACGCAGPIFDQPGVHDIYRSWNRLLSEYPGDRALVAEAPVEPLERVARYVRPDEMQQAFNFAYMDTPWDAGALRAVITESLRVNDAVGAPTTWVLSNHDTIRRASLLGLPETGRPPNGIGATDAQPDAELGLRRARAAALLMLALPGSAYLYQGEELGLPEHTTLDDELRQDPSWERSGRTERGRDGCRVPLPWRAEAPGFGFGANGTTWLPQPPGWSAYAVDAQDGVPGSTLELHRAALGIRRDRRLGLGGLAWVEGLPHDTIAFLNGDLLVLVNLGPEPVAVPADASVLLRSTGTDVNGSVPADAAVWAETAWTRDRRR